MAPKQRLIRNHYPAAGLNMGITSGIVPLEHQFL
ncbi:hypothetical protein BOH78_5004 [Pichia kudriavzevii]|uniref:Uncharacterized protein n=1 Tax=Pichia kudriavzevii TaxID=4909 RepID=A0A099NJF0_PICKU|nr:hypothetical protein JL09_g6698 [Pichia kudriavzevii]ONH70244.1 hypothetical protein BOH78_5387 [Pichia kudriavzevii]ONH70272.1 hypothetical protein BOH78_5361 [Pichia kudriavzevii]ONH70505.1 hypothetical protein BOH78_5172 [Pichia kudriavzevii]ONH70601.1 hypothetical protein BOH78_5112 [Pichia kudriavzevii]